MVIFCMHFATNIDMIVFIDIFHNKLWWGVCGFLFFFFVSCFLVFLKKSCTTHVWQCALIFTNFIFCFNSSLICFCVMM